jgi:hypothetical protein
LPPISARRGELEVAVEDADGSRRVIYDGPAVE